MSFWKAIVLSATSAQFVFETYLGLRQYSYINKRPRPSSKTASRKQNAQNKTQTYSRARLKYTLLNRLFRYVIDCNILYWDGYAKLWDTIGLALSAWAPTAYISFINQSLAFIYACFLIPALLNTPWAYYLHFHLEERFGFNKLSIKLWLTDLFKAQVISIALALFLKPAIIFFQYIGEFMFSAYGFPLFACQLLVPLLSPSLVPLFFTLVPLPIGPLRQSIQELSARVGFNSSTIKVIDGSKRTAHSNAYISGSLRKKIVLFDTLVAKLSNDEIVAVVAHEMGHWKRRHAVRLQIPLQIRMLLILNFARMLWMNAGLFDSFGFRDHDVYPAVVGVVLIRKVWDPLDMLTKLLINAQNRKYEFEADAFSAQLGNSAALCSALIKLNEQNLGMSDVDWLYSTYHSTHPSLMDRLRRLGWEAGDDHDKHS